VGEHRDSPTVALSHVTGHEYRHDAAWTTHIGQLMVTPWAQYDQLL